MTSIFDLKTDASELSSANEGTSKMEYDQHPPTRDVTNSNFSGGSIHIRWQTSGAKWWLPARSYLRMRCSITKADGSALTLGDDVAPSMNLFANLWQSMEFRINDKVVSRIGDFVSQIDSLETRLLKSKSWLEGIGASVGFWDADFKSRQNDVASDGTLITTSVETKVNQTTSRGQMAFDESGGTVLLRNQIAYEEATGILTFVQGSDGNGHADFDGRFELGDYFSYIPEPLGTVPGSVTLAQVNVPCKVLELIDATHIRVEPNIVGDVATDGRNDWERIRTSGTNEINDARKAYQFEMTWTPPLSIFKLGHALPGARYELVMVPQTKTVVQKRAIQSTLTDKVPNIATTGVSAGSNFKWNCDNLYMYVATVDGPRADNITYLLDLEQTRCQAEQIDNANFQQKNYDVSPSTYALTVAYQDGRAGQDTRISPSVFRSFDAATSSIPQELDLTRFYLNYAGQNLPSVDADPDFVSGKDYTVQRYTESQIYSGAMFDTGGAENITNFHKRGQYLYFSIPKDGTDRSTRVNVHNQFKDPTTDVVNMRVLLFDHSKQIARIKIEDGRVVDVQLEDN